MILSLGSSNKALCTVQSKQKKALQPENPGSATCCLMDVKML